MSLCTMFVFEGVQDPNLLHCTHRYYSDEQPVTRAQVINTLINHFASEPFKPFAADFPKLTPDFGDGSYRVVEPIDNAPFLPGLKEKLDSLHPDKFPTYRPHITVGRNIDEFAGVIRDYVLMDDHVEVWSAMKHFASLESEVRARLIRR